MAEFTPAPPELMERVTRLIDLYHPHLRGARIKVEIRPDTPTISHAVTWAEVDTPDNDAEAREFDFLLWFAADAWATLDDTQRDALVEHELYHCVYDDAGKPKLAPHSIEEFNGVLVRYGLWWPNAAATLDAIRQLPQLGERENDMPHLGSYQRPAQGTHGSSGAGTHGSSGAGTHGSSGAGTHGSSGAYGAPVWSDPDLVAGQDFHVIDIGNGRVLELTPQAFQAAVASILADLQGAMGQSPEPGTHGSSGA